MTSANGSISTSAVIPGGAYLDLLHSKVIDDPYWRFNENTTRWIAHTDWRYTTHLTIPPHLLALPYLELQFDGIDTVGEVMLDGATVLQVDNQFRRWVVDVTEAVKAGKGSHNLTVLLRSPVRYAAELAATYPYPLPRADPANVHPMGEREFVRKSQVDWGWNSGQITASPHSLACHTPIIRRTDSHSCCDWLSVCVCGRSGWLC